MAKQIALEWLSDRIDALGAGGHAARLETVEHLDALVSPVQVGESLRVWLAKEGLTAEKVVVVLPREAVVVRRLQLPKVPENELPDVVRFQAATKTSVPIESLALDYLPTSAPADRETQDVLTVTMDRDRLTRIVSVCAAAGLEVERVTLSSLGIGRLVRSGPAPDLGSGGPDLVLFQQGRRLELSIFDEGTLVFSHSMQLPEEIRQDTLKPLSTELTRSLMALNQSHPHAVVTRCFYVCGVPDPAVTELLQQRYGAGLVVVDHARLERKNCPMGFESLAGVMLPESHSQWQLDLLHPRQKVVAPDRRKFYLLTSAAVVLLVALTAGSLFYYQQAQLTADADTLNAEVTKQKSELDKAKPRFDEYEKLSRWKSGDTSQLMLWTAFKQHLPSTDRAYFRDIRILPSSQDEIQAQFLGQGQARSRTDIESLNQSLADQGYRVRPKTPILGKRDPDYPWEFELDVELPRGLAVQLLPALKSNGTATGTNDLRSGDRG